mmetsp:Transcript_87338/g.154836  ORF Transcript_87338/g.154836 Transcript_87338/m.154836 type:complete len:707 (-) Transcript_87338:94-2214(-)|eukprot:CAMPEP_0197690276 /NCGR_PEP_ID=MMETSP1338-20131121/108122_1 /TAXON_ID=43686 ORGANISM="Pelagodinium beii, Strain RCC1491" /NCGR_SAMPLE_ID=MMETSP1338 /ASSEMBLY_ACC=CAM_ASM_000754 /LENGTH=706 /DNA_ID=CAMNT_0043272713 /DNA_START=30 /DNA_END=2150 /DNA_ORIENTATION=+
MLRRTVLTAFSVAVAAGDYLESMRERLTQQTRAIAACQEDGFEFSWSGADGAIICTKATVSWNAVCSGCDKWRLYVFLDGGRDSNHGGEVYPTEAGKFYCGHSPCVSGWNLPLGGAWANTASLTLPDANPFHLKLPELPFLEGNWFPEDFMPNLHARYRGPTTEGSYSLCIKNDDTKWCFASSSDCSSLSGSCAGFVRSELEAVFDGTPILPGEVSSWQIRTDSVYEDLGTLSIEPVITTTTTWTRTVSTVTATSTSTTYSSTTTTTRVLTQAHAIAACGRDGFSFEWSSGNGAIICTIPPHDWSDACLSAGADCDTWRLYVFEEGGSDRSHGDELYETRAGRFYCGHDPCMAGWNLALGGTWNTTDLSSPALPQAQAVSLVGSGFPDLDGSWDPVDWTPNLQPRYMRGALRLCQMEYDRWCFTEFHDCEYVDDECHGKVQSKWGAGGKLPHEVDSGWQLWDAASGLWQDDVSVRVELTTSTLTATTSTTSSSTSSVSSSTSTITTTTVSMTFTSGPTTVTSTSTKTKMGGWSHVLDSPNVLTTSNSVVSSHCILDGSISMVPEVCSAHTMWNLCEYEPGCKWLIEGEQTAEAASSTTSGLDENITVEELDSDELVSDLSDLGILAAVIIGSTCGAVIICSTVFYMRRRAASRAQQVRDYSDDVEPVAHNWLAKKMSSSPVGRRSRPADKEAFTSNAIKIASRELS